MGINHNDACKVEEESPAHLMSSIEEDIKDFPAFESSKFVERADSVEYTNGPTCEQYGRSSDSDKALYGHMKPYPEKTEKNEFKAKESTNTH